MRQDIVPIPATTTKAAKGAPNGRLVDFDAIRVYAKKGARTVFLTNPATGFIAPAQRKRAPHTVCCKVGGPKEGYEAAAWSQTAKRLAVINFGFVQNLARINRESIMNVRGMETGNVIWYKIRSCTMRAKVSV